MSETREQYQAALDRINRSTDKEIDEAMAEILRQQRAVNRLRPAPRSAIRDAKERKG